MRTIVLIGLGVLAATSAVTNVGGSIEESLHHLRIISPKFR
jgi:hypothetical protein